MADQGRADWAESMSRLGLDCAGSCADDARKRLRAMWALLMTAPHAVLLEGVKLVDPVRMQALLTAEAFESAAVEMVGTEATYMTSLGPTGHLASVKLPGDEVEANCAADTFALAVVGALAFALSRRAAGRL